MKLKNYYKWWFEDYNPLDGRLRFLFYTLLFYFASKSLLPGAISRMEACPNSFFEAAGMMAWLIPAGVGPGEMSAFLGSLQYVIIFFWLSSALGLFGRLSPLITGIGAFIFWGAMQSCAGTGHDWHLPMYALLFLGFFMKNDRWSGDYLLAKRFRWYPFREFSRNKYGSIARKLILLTAVFILFSGGIAKLFSGGFSWLNGESLYYYLQEFNEPSSRFHGELLLELLLANAWLITILSVWTVLLELSSIIMLFKPKLRFFYVLNLWAFHFGIYLLMFPRYFPSMVCYLLIVNWRYTFSPLVVQLNKKIKTVVLRIPEMRVLTTLPPEGTMKKRLIFPSAIFIIFILTILFRIETFPLTHVPMYSTLLSEEKIGNFNRADFTRRETLKRIAKMYAGGENPWYLMFYYPRKIEIRVWVPHPSRPGAVEKNVTEEFKILTNNWPKWFEKVTEITLNDISGNMLFTTDPANQQAATAELLCEINEFLTARGEYKKIDKIGLVYHFDEHNEEIMLAVCCREEIGTGR